MDLTTLASVKGYLAIQTSGQDDLIPKLIARESRVIERWCGFTFPYVERANKRLNGTGTDRQMLPDSPILAVTLLQVGAKVYKQSPDGIVSGFMFDDSMLYLMGGDRFLKGFQNVLVSWTAGYAGSKVDFIPASPPYTLAPQDGGLPSIPISVTKVATSTPMAQVGSNPAAGQYSLSGGVYTFAGADAGQQVQMDYYVIPGPIEQACNEMVGLDLKQRDNLGISAKSFAQETITYETKSMSPSVKEMLQPFRKMIPV